MLLFKWKLWVRLFCRSLPSIWHVYELEKLSMKIDLSQIMADIETCFGSRDVPDYHQLSNRLKSSCEQSVMLFLLERFWVHLDTDVNVDRSHVLFLSDSVGPSPKYKLMISAVGPYVSLFPVKIWADGTREIGHALCLREIEDCIATRPLIKMFENAALTLLSDEHLNISVRFEGVESNLYNVLFSEY